MKDTEDNEEGLVMEIEAGLRDDGDGTLRAAVGSGIDEQLALVDAALRKGAPPAEYARSRTLLRDTGNERP